MRPCPTCHLDGGFHDEGRHAEHVVPAALLLTKEPQREDAGMAKPVNWSVYEPCDTCLQGKGEQCIHLQTNEPLDRPHKGRERTGTTGGVLLGSQPSD